MQDRLLMVRDMEQASLNTKMVANTKDSGNTTLEMAKDLRDTQMTTPILDASNLEKPMGMVYTLGRTARFTMVNGIRA